MGRKGKVQGAKTRTFYISEVHELALAKFKTTHGHKSDSEALRAVLDVVARTEGIDVGDSGAVSGDAGR